MTVIRMNISIIMMNTTTNSNYNNNNYGGMISTPTAMGMVGGIKNNSNSNTNSSTNNPNNSGTTAGVVVVGGGNTSGGGSSTSNLIRLTLRKPMGIVFEPMMDPHNPSQQRGVRICDLPRTGAAAMSQKLELGDELLSINDKTMSRLTFDEIMDFIIEADKERVDLLFRRPTATTTTTTTGALGNTTATAAEPIAQVIK